RKVACRRQVEIRRPGWLKKKALPRGRASEALVIDRFRAFDRLLQFRSGLLRLVAIVEGEQRLPRTAEMIGTEGGDRMRPLRVGQPCRCERLDLEVVSIEVLPERQLSAVAGEDDKIPVVVRIAGLH